MNDFEIPKPRQYRELPDGKRQATMKQWLASQGLDEWANPFPTLPATPPNTETTPPDSQGGIISTLLAGRGRGSYFFRGILAGLFISWLFF